MSVADAKVNYYTWTIGKGGVQKKQSAHLSGWLGKGHGRDRVVSTTPPSTVRKWLKTQCF